MTAPTAVIFARTKALILLAIILLTPNLIRHLVPLSGSITLLCSSVEWGRFFDKQGK